MFSRRLQDFIKLESASGILLILVLLVALIIANSPLYHYYDSFLDTIIQIRIGKLNLNKPILLWINDFLMAIFFMLLALEIKREILDGELSNFSQLALPVLAALGGILLPALVYLGFNYSNPETLKGWPIAITTDIAFALGIVAILGRMIPNSLKVFLVALSIVDDILAIAIIAIFYTAKLNVITFQIGIAGVIILLLFNFFGIKRIAPYLIVGLIIWVCVLKSGIHATLAGVIVGLTIPLNSKGDDDYSPLRKLEHLLHPWIAFFILPLFVFANGGVPLITGSIAKLLHPVFIGITLGLFIGKGIGVFVVSWLIIKLKCSKLPSESTWLQLFGISMLTGIGFTMSLFLNSLAFYNTEYEDLARKGILLGSFLSVVVAVIVFQIAYRLKKINST